MNWYITSKTNLEDYAPKIYKTKYENTINTLQKEHDALQTKQKQYYASIQLRLYILNLFDKEPSKQDTQSWINIIEENE